MDPDYQHLTLSARLAEYEEENQHAELLDPSSAPAHSRRVPPLRAAEGPAAEHLIVGYTSERSRTEGSRTPALPGDGEIPDQR